MSENKNFWEIKNDLANFMNKTGGKNRTYGSLITQDQYKEADKILRDISSRGIEVNEMTVLYIGKHYTLVKTAGGSYWDNSGRNYVSGDVTMYPLANMKPFLYYGGTEYPRPSKVWDLSKTGRYSTEQNKRDGRYGRLTKKRLLNLVREVEDLEKQEDLAGPCKACGKHINGYGPIGKACLNAKVCLTCSRKAEQKLCELNKAREEKEAALKIPEMLLEIQGELGDLVDYIGREGTEIIRRGGWSERDDAPDVCRSLGETVYDKLWEIKNKLANFMNKTGCKNRTFF